MPRLVRLSLRVWQVSPQGGIAPFRYPLFPSGYDAETLGSTSPLPSPDGRWIAFSQFGGDYDLHLLNVASGRERRITHFGRHPTGRYTYATVLIADWSSEGDAVLLAVVAGEDLSESDEGDLLIPDASYGHYTYSLVTGAIQSVPLPKTFEPLSWLPDDRFIGVLPGRSIRDDKLVILRPGKSGEIAVAAINVSLYQARASVDGKWLVGLHKDSGGPLVEGTAQIVKVNLATMAVTSLVPLGWWSGNEQPALSPDDKHVAYKREKREHETYFTPQESLFLDRQKIYSCPRPIDFKWVDDRMIAIACQDEVVVLDTNSGRTLGQYKIVSAEAGH